MMAKFEARLESKLVSSIMLQLNSKMDAALLNLATILRAVDPESARFIRPEDIPAMPMKCASDFKQMEKFLQNSTNFAALVSICFNLLYCVCSFFIFNFLNFLLCKLTIFYLFSGTKCGC